MNNFKSETLSEISANRKNKNTPVKTLKFPACELYVEKIIVVYVGSSTRPLIYHFENYTQMYKCCLKLGITDKTYHQFLEGVHMLSNVEYGQQSETYTFNISDLPNISENQKPVALPTGLRQIS